MSAVPLYAFVRGDTLGLLVLAQEDESIDELAARLMRAAAPRVKPSERLQVLHRGQPLRGDLKLREAGIEPLDRVDLVTGAEHV